MPTKRILVLGSGMVAKLCVNYLPRDVNNILTICGFLQSLLIVRLVILIVLQPAVLFLVQRLRLLLTAA